MFKYCLYVKDKDLPTWEFLDIYDDLDSILNRIKGIVYHHKTSTELDIRITKEPLNDITVTK